MREIKFRVWNGKNFRYDRYNQVLMFIQDQGGRFAEDWQYFGTALAVQQFTGFVDQNGKEIYEGDILKNSTGDTTVVKFSQHRELFGCGDVNGFFLPDNCGEVVGNIFETPQLLNNH